MYFQLASKDTSYSETLKNNFMWILALTVNSILDCGAFKITLSEWEKWSMAESFGS